MRWFSDACNTWGIQQQRGCKDNEMKWVQKRRGIIVAGARKRTNFAWTIRYVAVFAGFAKVSVAGSGEARRSTQQLLPTAVQSLTAHVRNAHVHAWTHTSGDNRFVDTTDYSKDYSGHANSRAYSYQERKISGAFPTSSFGAMYNP